MNVFALVKNVVIGRARNFSDKQLFHKASLVAMFAWVGLGADPVVIVMLRSRISFSGAGRAYLPKPVCGGGGDPDDCRHLCELFADHRTLSDGRRRLPCCQ